MKRLFVLSCVAVLFGFIGLTAQTVPSNEPPPLLQETLLPGPIKMPPASGAIIIPPPLLQGTPPADQGKQPAPPAEPLFVATDFDSLELPTAILQTDNQVSFPDIQQIALRNAKSIWGKVAQGPIIPYCDGQGRISAYVFTFRMGDDPFPRYGSAIREDKLTTKDGKSLYATMFVSARFDATPIPAYGYGLPPYYLRGLSALSVAEEQLGIGSLHLFRIYHLGTPLDLWFEFRGESENNGVVVDPYKHRTMTILDFQSYLGSLPKAKTNSNSKMLLKVREEWEKFIKGKTISSIPAYHYFSSAYNYVPFYDWDYGCSPTSAAMLLSFYRYYYINFGLLNLYFYERHFDPPPHHDQYHVAVAQQGLAMCMGTDTSYGQGGTYLWAIGPGIQSYTNTCRTPFSTSTIQGDSANYFAWFEMVAEIDSGRPFVWSVIRSTEGHTLCAIGYSDDGYIIVHDTWSNTLQYWFYSYYNNQYPAVSTQMDKVKYGTFLNQDVDLTSPHGGLGYDGNNGSGAETWQAGTTHNITWNPNGGTNGTVDLGYSVDGGLTWYQIALNRPNSGLYSWTIPNLQATSHARVMIQLNVSSQFTGCDGSYGNFYVSASGVEENPSTILPASFHIGPWSPNPFASSSAIAFDIPAKVRLSARLYDVTGREVKALASETLNQGNHVLRWDGKDSYGKSLPAGIYFSRMDLGSNVFTQKLILTR